MASEGAVIAEAVKPVDLLGRALDGGAGSRRRKLSAVGVGDFVNDGVAEVLG
ncbi:MAG TPA: hypothetical protein VF659_09335 [Pyrinomonadaceae bacterium]|jgi:hypothetical protein